MGLPSMPVWIRNEVGEAPAFYDTRPANNDYSQGSYRCARNIP